MIHLVQAHFLRLFTGKNPRISKRTEVHLSLSSKVNTKGWDAKIESKGENTIKVRVTTPANCFVGKWTLLIDNVKETGGSYEVHRYYHEPKIYILFNPWCKGRQDFILLSICFNQGLTHSHTMTPFDAPGKQAF